MRSHPIPHTQLKTNQDNLSRLKAALESQKVLYEIGKIAYILENEDNEIFAVIEEEGGHVYDEEAGEEHKPSNLFFNNYVNQNLFKQDDPMEIPLLPLLIPITNPRVSPPRRFRFLYW